MDPFEYLSEALEWWHQYALLLLLFLAVHWVMVRRWAVGFYDPLFMLLLSNAFGWTMVWFMYLRGDIEGRYVVSFTSAQVAFYLGFWARHPRRSREPPVPAIADGPSIPTMTLGLAMLVHVPSTLAIWVLAGIPLFRPSRLGAFEGSGGFGVLERLAESSALIAVFAVVYLLVHHRRYRRNLLVGAFIVWYLVSIALSGSKGALLAVGQYVLALLFVYTALRHRKDRFWGGRAGKALLIASVVFATAVLAVQREADLETAALGLLYRIVSYGDVYVFAYPDGTINQIRGDSAWIGLFGGFLSTFRLFPQESVYPNIGYQFMNIVFPDSDLIAGPNPQHPVFGYHYFGAFGFVFSFVLGLITAEAQRRLFHRAHSTFVAGLFAFMFYFITVSISVDFEYTLSKIASMIIGSMVVIFPILLLRPSAPLIRWKRSPSAAVGRPRSSSA